MTVLQPAADTATSPTGTPGRRRRPHSEGFLRNRAAWLFIAPWVVGFLVFTLWPLLFTGYLSFTDYDVINDPQMVGTANYQALMSEPKVRLALTNTFVFALMSVPTQLVISFGLALLLNRAGRATGFFRTAFFLPKMTPAVAVGVLLLLLFNGQEGLVNQVLGSVGIEGPAWTTDPDWVKPGLVMMSWWTVGASVVILLAALRSVPEELYDAARIDGAGFWRQTRHVTLPMVSSAVFFIVVVDTIAALQSFTEAYTAYFGAGNSTYSNDAALFYSIYLFQQAFEFLHMGYASAMALLLFVIILAVTAVQFWVTRGRVYYEGERA